MHAAWNTGEQTRARTQTHDSWQYHICYVYFYLQTYRRDWNSQLLSFVVNTVLSICCCCVCICSSCTVRNVLSQKWQNGRLCLRAGTVTSSHVPRRYNITVIAGWMCRMCAFKSLLRGKAIWHRSHLWTFTSPTPCAAAKWYSLWTAERKYRWHMGHFCFVGLAWHELQWLL